MRPQVELCQILLFWVSLQEDLVSYASGTIRSYLFRKRGEP